MDFVHEQDVAFVEVGEQGSQIAGLGDDRAGRGAKAHAHFLGDDLRQRGLAKAGRAEEEHMVQRLASRLRSLDKDTQIAARGFLPDKFVERFRAQRGVDILDATSGGEQAVFGHGRPSPTSSC